MGVSFISSGWPLFLFALLLHGLALWMLFLISFHAFLAWCCVIVVILDGGSGVPLLWNLFAPTFRSFHPTPQYQRIKSRYMMRG